MIAPKILDCTLRDGSYVIDFQFTAADTENIARELDEAGFPYIEVGHSVELGASEQGKNIAAASDVEYMQAAMKAVNRGKRGDSLLCYIYLSSEIAVCGSNIKTVAIVQARMGSTRFPGKMLARLGGIPLLEWVLSRLARANTLDQIVLATSHSENDNALADLAVRLGVQVYRGSESDVLARFVGAATLSNAVNVVRICADNPFIDPDEVDRLVNFFAQQQCDYACNHQDRLGSGYADGFGAEIFTAGTLKKIATMTKEPRHREHATLYLWDHPKEFNLAAIQAPAGLSFPELRFDVDTPEDLQKMQQWVDAGVTIDSTAQDIIALARSTGRFASDINNGVLYA